ncbi:DNA-directed RNA polymerase [Phenylobacterium sp.]|uniref:DNA-directed RNA polymerase n=1 Tax=Phenylobacterium sp. TaxID=1871053 RepID=UPI002737AB98|nr:DNA-directed RNA polymerase [Phenylobacterium sp.]MDP3869897.1 DNA-directed RNA polymerase [Phenylobacterium sp.]
MQPNEAIVDQALLTAIEAVATELSDPAMERQFDLESEMVENGKHRYWDRATKLRPGVTEDGHRRSGEESRTAPSMCLLRMALNPMREGIVAFLEAANSGKPGRRHLAVKHLRLVDPETAAFLTLKRCLDAFSTSPDMTNLCIKIGRTLEDEVRLRTFEKSAKGLLLAIQARFKTSNFSHHRKVLNVMAARAGIDLGVGWTKTEALQCGAALLTIVVEHTGLFEVITERQGAKQRCMVRPTAETSEWVRKRDLSAQFLFPTFMPLVVKPRPWTGPTGGGYHFGLAGKLRLVKNRNRGYQSELKNMDMPIVLRAVNALQDTPWEVNPLILGMVASAARSGSTLGGLPETAINPIPPAPAGIPLEREERTEEQQQQLRAWKGSVRVLYEENLERRQQSLVLARCVAIAEQYQGEAAFYFPYTLDFRGRAYPASQYLHPQGCDYQKALLRFAVAKPLGDQGACWLAIHGANLMGDCPTTGQSLDKGQLQERIDWVSANEDRILATAADPMGNEWWTQADQPWQFLAFCSEWAGYVAEGNAFKSRIPVALDGSCNGLQHFSAMLRDEVGGAAVNLIPRDRPADIYMEVCRKALAQAASDAAEGNVTAAMWLASGEVDRDMCKQPVMTMPYGSKQYGIRDQLVNKLRKRGHSVTSDAGEESDGWAECGYLAGAIWTSLGSVVIKAREAMDWLQACAAISATQELPITWETPDGFLVLQDYRITYEKQVDTKVAGKLYWPKLREEKEALSKQRQQSGVAPNFVHSMDGCAMRLCIDTSLDHGIENFAMIHDSYATHAGDTEVFFRLIRTSFSRMYSDHDVLASFMADMVRQLTPENLALLPPMPVPGNLDLSLVEGSDFFFA